MGLETVADEDIAVNVEIELKVSTVKVYENYVSGDAKVLPTEEVPISHAPVENYNKVGTPDIKSIKYMEVTKERLNSRFNGG